ncbi:MAG: hypothetical protein M1609_01505 [Firmicutes bacterium]|nr:hypothetical protein [Bacillota bacterium]
MLATYQTRIDDRTPYPYFEAMGEYFGHLERKLFVDCCIHSTPITKLKKRYIKEHRITARQFNSLNNSLSGKIESIKENQKYQEHDLLGRIASTEKAIKKKEKERDKIIKSLKKLQPRMEKWQKKIDRLKRIKFFLHQKKKAAESPAEIGKPAQRHGTGHRPHLFRHPQTLQGPAQLRSERLSEPYRMVKRLEESPFLQLFHPGLQRRVLRQPNLHLLAGQHHENPCGR